VPKGATGMTVGSRARDPAAPAAVTRRVADSNALEQSAPTRAAEICAVLVPLASTARQIAVATVVPTSALVLAVALAVRVLSVQPTANLPPALSTATDSNADTSVSEPVAQRDATALVVGRNVWETTVLAGAPVRRAVPTRPEPPLRRDA